MPSPFARLPSPPYHVAIFASQRSSDDEEGYAAMAERMAQLASTQAGYLGIESARGDDGFGITVSYWLDEASILAWKRNAEHATARSFGRSHWYDHFELRIAKVERAHGKQPDA